MIDLPIGVRFTIVIWPWPRLTDHLHLRASLKTSDGTRNKTNKQKKKKIKDFLILSLDWSLLKTIVFRKDAASALTIGRTISIESLAIVSIAHEQKANIVKGGGSRATCCVLYVFGNVIDIWTTRIIFCRCWLLPNIRIPRCIYHTQAGSWAVGQFGKC